MDEHARSVGVAAGAVLAGATTLVCCVLPAVMVSLGAGAALAALVSAFPQLIWLSERKLLVFSIALALLLASGLTLWRTRQLPCPTDPALGRRCNRLRRMSNVLATVALLAVAIGAVFAFLLPALG